MTITIPENIEILLDRIVQLRNVLSSKETELDDALGAAGPSVLEGLPVDHALVGYALRNMVDWEERIGAVSANSKVLHHIDGFDTDTACGRRTTDMTVALPKAPLRHCKSCMNNPKW